MVNFTDKSERTARGPPNGSLDDGLRASAATNRERLPESA